MLTTIVMVPSIVRKDRLTREQPKNRGNNEAVRPKCVTRQLGQ